MSDEPTDQPARDPGFAPPGGSPPAPPPPPAAFPDQPPAPGWWKASDGNWYPPHQQPAGPPPGPPTAGPAGDRWVPPPVGHGPGHPGTAPDGSLYYHSPAAAPAPSKGLARWALVLGIISILTFWTCGVGVLIGILAVVFGIMGRNRAREAPESGYAGPALAGLVLGILGVVGGIGFLAVVVPDLLDEVENELEDGVCEQDVEFLDPDC